MLTILENYTLTFYISDSQATLNCNHDVSDVWNL